MKKVVAGKRATKTAASQLILILKNSMGLDYLVFCCVIAGITLPVGLVSLPRINSPLL